jgi:hypothetical protein
MFCNTINHVLLELHNVLVLVYMDDVTLESQVAKDVETIRRRGEEIGLRLNDKKCEYISNSVSTTTAVFQHFMQLDPENATLLEAIINTGKAIDTVLETRCADLSGGIWRLSLIAAHDALVLLRASFSAPKPHHSIRSFPCAGHPALDVFDNKLRG